MAEACKNKNEASQTAAETPAVDPGWPRQIELANETVIFYQPQVSEWKDYLHLHAMVAIEVVPNEASKPRYLGVATVTADTETDFDRRQVLIYNKKLESLTLENADPSMVAPLEQQLRALQTHPEIISLDRLIPMVTESTESLTQTEISVKPPVIFYSASDAILVILDGEPIWAQVADGATLQYAVNTNWDLFQDKKNGQFYLLDDAQWLTAQQLEGNWTTTTSLPEVFSNLPNDENWTEVRQHIPAKSGATAPKVFVSKTPAELILTEGAPQFEAIAGTQLMKIKNTDSDLYLYSPTSNYYFLVSGRWFRSASLEGPWTFATPNLPADFAQLPVNEENESILATVPGTSQAKEAAVQAEIPQTAEVSKDVKAPEVTYTGSIPEFENITATMSYAKNTPSDVIKVENTYYLCSQGVWFYSPYPTYGFVVCTTVPPPIYTIPPYCPVYHVTFVHCYGYSATHVTFGYTAGYSGVYISYGVPMYGTGFYYPPYYYPAPRPIYYPYPYSYGFHASYNPYTGTYRRSAYVYGPYGGAGCGSAYNPYTGTYARGRSVWGPYGAAGEAAAYNPRTGTHAYAQTVQTPYGGATRGAAYNERTGTAAATRQGHNPYAQWGQSAVTTKNGNWARTGHYTDANGTTRAFKTSSGASGISHKGEGGSSKVVKSGSGDLYVGHNGQVYKREDGNWQSNSGGSWQNANQAQTTPAATQNGATTRQTPSQSRQAGESSSNRQPATQPSKDISQKQKPAASAPNTRQQPATPPSTRENKPAQQPSGAENRTAQQPATREAPASQPRQPETTRPSAPAQTQATRPNPYTVPAQTNKTPSASNAGGLDNQYHARERGNTRSGNYQNYQSKGGQASGGRSGGGRRRN